MPKVDERILNRLNELVSMGETVTSTACEREPYAAVDRMKSSQWGTSCLAVLSKAFGQNSDYYEKFKSLASELYTLGFVCDALGVLKAAKEDFEKDMLFDTRSLIEAELFVDFLEQAKYLLDAGYHAPAAVITGGVLEDAIRKLCERNAISITDKPKLDTMNANLAKAGVYNKLQLKRITAIADIRNKAAHGQWDEFSKKDVEDMLRSVETFMEDNFK